MWPAHSLAPGGHDAGTPACALLDHLLVEQAPGSIPAAVPSGPATGAHVPLPAASPAPGPVSLAYEARGRPGAAALDASSLSFDHAVPIDPLVVERIDVLRGPAALLYGGSAVGGVLNAIDNRIPKLRIAAGRGRFVAEAAPGSQTNACCTASRQPRWGKYRVRGLGWP